MVTATKRMSADDRREQVIEAALVEFAQYGLAGTSTEVIAARAGISQPYLFRLFATKRDLFIAAATRCIDNIASSWLDAANGLAGEAAMVAMGHSYMALIADRDNLLVQLQLYAACADADIRECARNGYRKLYAVVEAASGATPEQISLFFASGMLCNVTTALSLGDLDEPWARSLVTPGKVFPC